MGECTERSEFLTWLSGATAPVQPIFQFEEAPERIRLKSSTPAKEVLSGRFYPGSHPCCDLLIISARRDEISQRLCRQASRFQKSAVHRAIETIGAGLAEELCAALVHQSCGPHREILECGERTPWRNAIQVGCQGAKFFDVHAVSSNEEASGLPGTNAVGRLAVS
jgi:hypothetical protein